VSCQHQQTSLTERGRICASCGAPVTWMSDLVASPSFAPREWQSHAPEELFSGRGAPVGDSPDLTRVLNIPRREPLDLTSPRARAMVEMMTRRWARPLDPSVELVASDADMCGRYAEARQLRGCKCASIDVAVEQNKRKCITRMLPVQAWSLYELGMARGLLASVPVGGGKTFIWLMSMLALDMTAQNTGLLLIPPSLLEQVIIDYQLIAQHFHVPAMEVHGSGDTEQSFAVEGMPKLHVLPYSKLSRPESTDYIERVLHPDVIIADECDKLKDPGTATCARVLRYFAAHPRCLFCGGTGSLTSAKISQMSHLGALALRGTSPMPLEPEVVEDWGRCLDAVESPCPPGSLLRLCRPGEHVREGFHRRFAETLGVITTIGENEVLTSGAENGGVPQRIELVVDEKPAPLIPPIVLKALELVRDGKRPDTMAGSRYDEDLVDALAQAKCAHEVATGMFYRWKFPPIDGVPQRREVIDEWYLKRKAWNCELRQKLLTREEHMDSPHLCENAAQRHWGMRPKNKNLPEWKSKHYPAWHEIAERVVWEPDAVYLDDYLARDAAEWGLRNRGIIWYNMVEFGAWIAKFSGILGDGNPLTMHGGGPKAGARLRGERGERSIIASLKSHGRGRNGLQFLYDTQLVVNPPSDAAIWEQLLGRTHRQGQTSTEVTCLFYRHTDELRDTIDQALRRALYVEQILGATQKLRVGFQF
jgi:hypothetical protein